MTNRKWNAGGKVTFSSLHQAYYQFSDFAIPLPSRLKAAHLPLGGRYSACGAYTAKR